RCFKKPAPLRDQLTVTGEYDRLGRIWRDVHRDLPTTVVVEPLGDKFARDRVGPRRRCLGEFVHAFTLPPCLRLRGARPGHGALPAARGGADGTAGQVLPDAVPDRGAVGVVRAGAGA